MGPPFYPNRPLQHVIDLWKMKTTPPIPRLWFGASQARPPRVLQRARFRYCLQLVDASRCLLAVLRPPVFNFGTQKSLTTLEFSGSPAVLNSCKETQSNGREKILRWDLK